MSTFVVPSSGPEFKNKPEEAIQGHSSTLFCCHLPQVRMKWYHCCIYNMCLCPLLYWILTDMERMIGTSWKNNREKVKVQNRIIGKKKHIWLRPTCNEVQFLLVKVSTPYSTAGQPITKIGLGMRLICKLIMCHKPLMWVLQSNLRMKDTLGMGRLVLCSEVVHISEVQLYNPQIMFYWPKPYMDKMKELVDSINTI